MRGTHECDSTLVKDDLDPDRTFNQRGLGDSVTMMGVRCLAGDLYRAHAQVEKIKAWQTHLSEAAGYHLTCFTSGSSDGYYNDFNNHCADYHPTSVIRGHRNLIWRGYGVSRF